MWRKHLQPAAQALNLKRMSPTIRPDSRGDEQAALAGTGPDEFAGTLGSVKWLHTFLSVCWSYRNDAAWPCDVDAIDSIAVHKYVCNADK